MKHLAEERVTSGLGLHVEPFVVDRHEPVVQLLVRIVPGLNQSHNVVEAIASVAHFRQGETDAPVVPQLQNPHGERRQLRRKPLVDPVQRRILEYILRGHVLAFHVRVRGQQLLQTTQFSRSRHFLHDNLPFVHVPSTLAFLHEEVQQRPDAQILLLILLLVLLLILLLVQVLILVLLLVLVLIDGSGGKRQFRRSTPLLAKFVYGHRQQVIVDGEEER